MAKTTVSGNKKISLNQQLSQREAELDLINSVQQGLASKLDMQAIYDLVGDKVRDIFDAQTVLIGTFDTTNQIEEFKYNIEKGQRHPHLLPAGTIRCASIYWLHGSLT